MLASPQATNSSLGVPEDPDRPVGGIIEPPNSFAWTAITRHILVVCALAVVGVLIGVGYGVSRPSTYTAAATLQVGQVNPNSPGFYSYVQSAAALATAFSRAIDAEPVLAAVQRELKLGSSKAAARLSAEPLPQSPAFRIVATGTTASGAIRLANVTSNALISYESQTNSANPEAASLLHEYHEASLDLQQASARVGNVEHFTAGAGRAVSSSALAAAKANQATAAARLRAIDTAYTAAVTSQAPRSGLVSLLAGATSAVSNRRSRVELLGFIGLLAGIVVGSAVAVLKDYRRLNRRLGMRIDIGAERSEQV